MMQKWSKTSPSEHHHATLSGYIFATKACIDNRKKNLFNSNTCSTCRHNIVNIGPLTAEIVSTVWALQHISTGFASSVPYCTDVAQWRSTKLCTVFVRLLGCCTIYTFWGLLPPDGILPRAKFTLRPSLAFSYIDTVTARQSSSGRQPSLRRWEEGATYIRQDGHHVGHRPHSSYVYICCFVITFRSALILLFEKYSHIQRFKIRCRDPDHGSFWWIYHPLASCHGQTVVSNKKCL